MLENVDLSQTLDDATYRTRRDALQDHLHTLCFQVYRARRPVVMVFEGWDAAGKGGTIRQIAEALDPRDYVVYPIAAPEGEDRTHHYLYRFWRRLPPTGHFAIFDRSWYGRVLVERIEGYARPEEWQRAYREINDFERGLTEFGTILFKFWLHISPDEQLRRFQARRAVLYKQWKLTDEDWRNRAKWQAYYDAVNDMLLKTSLPHAPWTVVPAETKNFGRVYALQTVVDTLAQALGQ
jgi:AMP-polyphosphate phosphotransferase